MSEEELRNIANNFFVPPDVQLRIGLLESERDQLRTELDAVRKQLEVACHVQTSDKTGFDWAVLALISDSCDALNNLADAVAYDMRHGDDPDEDKSWEALIQLRDALSAARAMIDRIDGKASCDSPEGGKA